MQKIVNGLLYDTEVSEVIYFDEARTRRWYLTPNGNYFILYGTGEIHPTTEENVKAVLGEHDIAKYIELFGEPQEA